VKIITCYRPCGPKELELVACSNYKEWPPRLPDQPFFYPVTNEKYAVELTQWNVKDYGIGFVTEFLVNESFMGNYDIQCVGAGYHTEWWVPADHLDMLNANIIGGVKVVGEYKQK